MLYQKVSLKNIILKYLKTFKVLYKYSQNMYNMMVLILKMLKSCQMKYKHTNYMKSSSYITFTITGIMITKAFSKFQYLILKLFSKTIL